MPALIFDCDGVLADTEKDGHLPAFNEAFAEFELDLHWDVPTYAEKVKIGGGKERIASVLPPRADTEELVKAVHKRKTELFLERVRQGLLPGRPGIHRIVADALAAGWTVAVASTSAEPSVRGVLEHAVGADLAARCHVYAGDIVAAKKPAPDIYLLVLHDLGLDPAECVVVEDSGIGLQAALAAGLTTVITVSTFTADDDFAGAALIVDSLGDPDRPAGLLGGAAGLISDGYVTLSHLGSLLPSNHQEETR
jgi:haloacid dehalogenase superfamily, subfamily IA, variant 3 with third motif having DD or ED